MRNSSIYKVCNIQKSEITELSSEIPMWIILSAFDCQEAISWADCDHLSEDSFLKLHHTKQFESQWQCWYCLDHDTIANATPIWCNTSVLGAGMGRTWAAGKFCHRWTFRMTNLVILSWFEHAWAAEISHTHTQLQIEHHVEHARSM